MVGDIGAVESDVTLISGDNQKDPQMAREARLTESSKISPYTIM